MSPEPHHNRGGRCWICGEPWPCENKRESDASLAEFKAALEADDDPAPLPWFMDLGDRQ